MSIARANKVVENLRSWDDAIHHAKARIKQLKKSVQTFEENKKRKEPWPGKQSLGQTA
jgi:uncharacterized protein (DUF342 family)